MKNIWFVYII